MSTKTICNRCNTEIKTGISIGDDTGYPPYYKLDICKYSHTGRLIESSKDYHLCENCGNIFENEFINAKKDDTITRYIENLSNEEVSNFLNSKKYLNNSHVDSYKGTTVYGDCSVVKPIDSEYAPNTINLSANLSKDRSDMVIGNVHIHTTKLFNKLEKFMWKKFFGVTIEELNQK